MAEIKTGPDPARLPWVESEPATARTGVRGFAGWILAAVILLVGVGFFLLGSRRETPVAPQQPNTTVPVQSSAPQPPKPSEASNTPRTHKSAAATTSAQSKPGAVTARREQQKSASTANRSKAAAPAKAVASQVAAKAEQAAKAAPSQVAAKTAPKAPAVAVTTKGKAATTEVAAATSSSAQARIRHQRRRTQTASATPRTAAVPPRSPAYGPILATPDLRPAERFGGIAQIGAFTDKRQADLVWRDMVRANGALEQARVSLIQNRDWNGQLFYQFQVATASPQDSEILCRSMQQINVRCAVVSIP